ncbi:hypothetical protein SAMN02746093_03185, partial [Legionella quinlivanii DSM 21216]|uniref:hypothetical protein n=2 Tax=Legionella quinlivanii TaxID=45073 RepID=UPI00089EF322
LEMKGLEREEIQEGLTGSELSVAGNFSHFNVRGELTNILDLTNEETLRPFFQFNHRYTASYLLHKKSSRNKIKCNATREKFTRTTQHSFRR